LIAFALCGSAGAGFADGGANGGSTPTIAPAASSLPTFAQTPSGAPDPWAGLTIGGDLSVSGGKGIKGGVGGDAYLTYQRALPNNLIVGVQAVSGYTPGFAPKWSRVNGYDYAGASAFVGYDAGQFEPYVFSSVDFAKANLGPAGRYDTSQSLDDLFNKGGGPLLTATTVGAGINYAVTNNFSMGMSVSVTQFNHPAAFSPVIP
jgi:opacity protein-like surface antigen